MESLGRLETRCRLWLDWGRREWLLTRLTAAAPIPFTGLSRDSLHVLKIRCLASPEWEWASGWGWEGGWWELGETERWRESTGRRYTFFRTPKSQNIISSTLFARRGSLRPAHTGELKIEFYFLQKGLSKTYLKITSLRPVGFSTESCTNVSYAPCSSRMGSFHH